MNSRTRSRRPTSIGSNQSSRRWIAVWACDCRAAEFVLLLVMAWSPPALKRRDCLGFSTRRLRHLQFQPHPGRHRLVDRSGTPVYLYFFQLGVALVLQPDNSSNHNLTFA